MHNKSVRSFISDWLIPPAISELRRKACFSREMERRGPLTIENRVLNGIEAGKRCFILATGPSISKQDLKPLKNETCIAVSNFFVHPDFPIIQPKYYCLAPHHPPITEEAWRDWMQRIDTAIPDSTRFFISLADKVRDEKAEVFLKKRLSWLNYAVRWEEGIDKIDLSGPLPYGQSVSIMALMVALGLGFSQIFLLGCDHDWILHVGQAKHFYAEERHAFTDHGYHEWIGNDIGIQFATNAELWRQYRVIKALASKSGIEIMNATSGGLLDVFPRTNLQTILN